MALLYRADLRAEPPCSLAELTEALERWLLQEHRLGLTDISDASSQTTPVVDWRFDDAGGSWSARLEVQSASDDVVRVLAASDDAATDLLVERHDPVVHSTSQVRSKPAPEIIKALLDMGLWSRGGASLTSNGKLLDADELTNAITARESAEDAVPLVIVSCDPSTTSITRIAATLLTQLRGSADVVSVLATDFSPVAMRYGLRSKGRAGSVAAIVPAPGSLRWSELPATVVSSQPEAAARRLQASVLAVSATRPMPSLLQHGMRRLLRLHVAQEGIDELVDDLERRERDIVVQRDLLQSELVAAKDQLQFSWLEQQELLDQLQDAQARARYLERHMLLSERFQVPDPDIEEEEAYLQVDSCEQVLQLGRESLLYVLISARPGPARDLDVHPKSELWARKAWEWLRALDDYARLKAEGRWSGGLIAYCTGPPVGSRPLPLNSFAPRESESTESRPDLVAARTFPVSEMVDTAGRAFMPAHLKIDRGGSPAPRIHLLDDTGGATGKIHIGYFGPHLPTGG